MSSLTSTVCYQLYVVSFFFPEVKDFLKKISPIVNEKFKQILEKSKL